MNDNRSSAEDMMSGEEEQQDVMVLVWRSDLVTIFPHVDQGCRFLLEHEQALGRLQAATAARTADDMLTVAMRKYEAQEGSSGHGESSPERGAGEAAGLDG